MTPEEQRLAQIFFPYAVRRQAELKDRKRFVHYTNARAAMSIIKNKEVWMRNATCMNDYTEVRHGLDCLVEAYREEHGQRLRKILEEMFLGFCKEFEDFFNGWIEELKFGTFFSCVSEHDRDEDEHGRLSMWRAYGHTTGIAIVLDSAPFFSESDALNAYSSPVAYLDSEGFKKEFGVLAGC